MTVLLYISLSCVELKVALVLHWLKAQVGYLALKKKMTFMLDYAGKEVMFIYV